MKTKVTKILLLKCPGEFMTDCDIANSTPWQTRISHSLITENIFASILKADTSGLFWKSDSNFEFGLLVLPGRNLHAFPISKL